MYLEKWVDINGSFTEGPKHGVLKQEEHANGQNRVGTNYFQRFFLTNLNAAIDIFILNEQFNNSGQLSLDVYM